MKSPIFWVLLSENLRRFVVDPTTNTLWRFPTRDEAVFFSWREEARGMTIYQAREDPKSGMVSIATFGAF